MELATHQSNHPSNSQKRPHNRRDPKPRRNRQTGKPSPKKTRIALRHGGRTEYGQRFGQACQRNLSRRRGQSLTMHKGRKVLFIISIWKTRNSMKPKHMREKIESACGLCNAVQILKDHKEFILGAYEPSGRRRLTC